MSAGVTSTSLASLIQRVRHFEAMTQIAREKGSNNFTLIYSAKADLAHLTLRRRMAMILSRAGR